LEVAEAAADEAAEAAEPAADAADEAADEAEEAALEVDEVTAAEEGAAELLTAAEPEADDEPVVVTAAVERPLVDAEALRHELEVPAWIWKRVRSASTRGREGSTYDDGGRVGEVTNGIGELQGDVGA
jgi:hypothetical protein